MVILLLLSALVGLFSNLASKTTYLKNTQTAWQWPVAITFDEHEGNVNFTLREALAALVLEKEVKKNGYTRIEEFLKDEGKKSGRNYKYTSTLRDAVLLCFIKSPSSCP